MCALVQGRPWEAAPPRGERGVESAFGLKHAHSPGARRGVLLLSSSRAAAGHREAAAMADDDDDVDHDEFTEYARRGACCEAHRSHWCAVQRLRGCLMRIRIIAARI